MLSNSIKDFRHDWRFKLLRKINHFCTYHPFRKSYAYQFALGKFLLPKYSGLCIVKTIYGFDMVINVVADHKLNIRGGSSDRNIYYLGTYEPGSMEYFLKFVKHGASRVVDIGAYAGQYAISSAYAGAKSVIAFEPVEQHLSIIKENVRVNNIYTVEVKQIALSDKESSDTVFYVSSSKPGSSSLFPDEDTVFDNKVKVKVSTLDRELDSFPADIIKIDAEGAEFSIIKGGEKFLRKNNPIIMFEHRPGNNAEIFVFLKELDYRFFHCKNSRHFISHLVEIPSLNSLPVGIENIFALPNHSKWIDQLSDL